MSNLVLPWYVTISTSSWNTVNIAAYFEQFWVLVPLLDQGALDHVCSVLVVHLFVAALISKVEYCNPKNVECRTTNKMCTLRKTRILRPANAIFKLVSWVWISMQRTIQLCEKSWANNVWTCLFFLTELLRRTWITLRDWNRSNEWRIRLQSLSWRKVD